MPLENLDDASRPQRAAPDPVPPADQPPTATRISPETGVNRARYRTHRIPQATAGGGGNPPCASRSGRCDLREAYCTTRQWLRRHGVPRDVADDVAQQVVRRVWREVLRAARGERPPIRNLPGLVVTITWRELARYHERNRVMVSHEIDRVLDPSAVSTPCERVRIDQALAALEPDERRVVVLWWRGLSQREIARRLRFSNGRVSNLFRRGIARLRVLLADLRDFTA